MRVFTSFSNAFFRNAKTSYFTIEAPRSNSNSFQAITLLLVKNVTTLSAVYVMGQNHLKTRSSEQ